jgi:hypothetical protein
MKTTKSAPVFTAEAALLGASNYRGSATNPSIRLVVTPQAVNLARWGAVFLPNSQRVRPGARSIPLVKRPTSERRAPAQPCSASTASVPFSKGDPA